MITKNYHLNLQKNKMSAIYEKTSSQRIKLKSSENGGELPTMNKTNKNYFVRHSKQEMFNYNPELAECEGWETADMIDIDFHKGEYHEVMFGPFDKKKAETIFVKIKNIKNLHYSITQGEWEETSSIHGKKGIKRTTGYNYHDEGYYYEYLSIENPQEQSTNMSVDEWLEKMAMTECLEKGLDSEDENSDSEDENSDSEDENSDSEDENSDSEDENSDSEDENNDSDGR